MTRHWEKKVLFQFFSVTNRKDLEGAVFVGAFARVFKTLLLRITTRILKRSCAKCARHVVSCHAFLSQLREKRVGQTSSIKRMASESPTVVASLSNESRPTGRGVREKFPFLYKQGSRVGG